MSGRPNIYTQDIPLQHRQGYGGNNTNAQPGKPVSPNTLQTPAYAYTSVGRSRSPDGRYNNSPSSPVSPRSISSPRSPVSPIPRSPVSPVPRSPVSPMPRSPVSPVPVSPISPSRSPTYNPHPNQSHESNYYQQQRPAQSYNPAGSKTGQPHSPNTANFNLNSAYGDSGNEYRRNNTYNSNSGTSASEHHHQRPSAPYRQQSNNSLQSYNSQVQGGVRSPGPTVPPERNAVRRLSITPSGNTEMSVTEKYNISPTSSHHLCDSNFEAREPDDDMHDPEEVFSGRDRRCVVCSKRGCLNVGALVLILFGILGLFAAYPVYSAIRDGQLSDKEPKSDSPTATPGNKLVARAEPTPFITPGWDRLGFGEYSLQGSPNLNSDDDP